jgi:hypothetical protein
VNILFDHNMPQRLRRYLRDHQVTTTQQMGWEELVNGDLLRAAADGGFDLLLTLDKKIEYEHNLGRLPLPVVLFGMARTAMTSPRPHPPDALGGTVIADLVGHHARRHRRTHHRPAPETVIGLPRGGSSRGPCRRPVPVRRQDRPETDAAAIA